MSLKITSLLIGLCFAFALSFQHPAQADFADVHAAWKGDYATALKDWRLAAKQGDATAQYNLGLIYNMGLGVTQDYKEAVKWYRLAAKQGVAEAQSTLGMMYRQGRVVTQDYKEAVEMIRERVIAGLERAKAKGVKLGRRRISEDRVHKIRQLREQGWGMNKISRELRVGSATVQKICKS